MGNVTKRGRKKRDETRGERNIRWIESYCRVPEGPKLGAKVKLLDFQKAEIIKIYDNPAGTRRAIISWGRKNAKSTLAAFLLLLHLAGPEMRHNSQLFSAAQSRDQAALIFSLAAKIVRMSPDLRIAIIVRDAAKQLFCPELGTLYRALSADAATAYGLSPVFMVHDELGQVRGPRSALYEALETATGAQENPLSVIISTQAPTDADLLSILIDDAMAGNDARVTCSIHSAPTDADPFDEAVIRLANPAFGEFLNPIEVMAMAQDAKRMPAREAEYRNLVLNQRVESSSPFITAGMWKACGAAPMSMRGRDCYGGLDLSETADLTAFVLIASDENLVWSIEPTFWLPGEGLADKARADRVPYDKWAEQGYLQTTPGRSIGYDFIARYLIETFQRYRIRKIGFDRWNMVHLKPWLIQAGMSEQQIEQIFVPFGQGTKSMSPALRELEGLILDRKLRHGDHPVLTMCMANAVTEGMKEGHTKDSSNRKLSKKRSAGRIDGAVALAMACGVAPLGVRNFDAEALIG